jgi:two-component system LytT family sensor kinase
MVDQKLILVTLLIRLGAAAAVSSVLVRARRFRQLLFHEERTLKEQVELIAIMSVPIALGVLTRHWVKNFLAADLSFEFSILMGVIGGRVVGAGGAAVVSIPAVLFGEWATLPFNVLVGIAK